MLPGSGLLAHERDVSLANAGCNKLGEEQLLATSLVSSSSSLIGFSWECLAIRCLNRVASLEWLIMLQVGLGLVRVCMCVCVDYHQHCRCQQHTHAQQGRAPLPPADTEICPNQVTSSWLAIGFILSRLLSLFFSCYSACSSHAQLSITLPNHEIIAAFMIAVLLYS